MKRRRGFEYKWYAVQLYSVVLINLEEGFYDELEKLYKNVSSDYHTTRPATIKDIRLIKEKLNVDLPRELEDLLSETDGVYDQFDCHLLWSINKIVEENLYFREWEDFKDLYMPFDHLLFFSDAGNGDLFGYTILNGQIQREDIYVWNHEDDSRTWIASSLKEFIEGWITGEISV